MKVTLLKKSSSENNMNFFNREVKIDNCLGGFNNFPEYYDRNE